MKKVLIIDPFCGSIAGAQKVTLNVIKFLQKKHYKLSIIARKKDSIHTKALNDFSIIGHLPLEFILKKVFGQGNFDNSKKNLFTYLKIITSLIFCNLYCLYKAIKVKPDYVYTYDIRGLFVSCLLLKLFGFKVVWHLHGQLNYSSFLISCIQKICTKIIAPSHSVTEPFKDRGIVKVIYNGFDFEDTKPLGKVDNKRQLELIFLGTLLPHKGVHNLILALNEPLLSNYNLSLSIFGEFDSMSDLEYKDYLLSLTQKVNKQHSVSFRGWSTEPSHDISKSDILVFPSVISGDILLGGKLRKISSSEALPTVLIEALVHQTPAIATNTPGVDEILCNPNDGIIIADSEPGLISCAINKIALNTDLFIPNSTLYREKFSLNKMESELMSVFS